MIFIFSFQYVKKKKIKPSETTNITLHMQNFVLKPIVGENLLPNENFRVNLQRYI